MMCREFVEFLLDYFEGNLPDDQRRPFEEHLRLCPPCVRYLETYRETVQLGRAAFASAEEDCGDDIPDELVRAVLSTLKRNDAAKSGDVAPRGDAPPA